MHNASPATLHTMKGNLRPQSTMSQPFSEPLPSARIRCNRGRIQVGSRTYQSASDALSAYMQQFDPKRGGSVHAAPSTRNASLGSVLQKGIQNMGSPRKCDPANVTGLLTGGLSYAHQNGVSLDSTVSDSSNLFNGVSPVHRSAKHSVSFALPESVDSSLHSNSKLIGGNGSSQNSTNSRPHPSSQFNDSSKLHSWLTLNSASQNGTSDSLQGLTQSNNANNTPSHCANPRDAPGQSLSTPHRFVDNGLPAGLSNSFSPHAQQTKETESSGHAEAGRRHAKSEVEMLLTEAPSQSELSSLGQVSAGEGKLRTLLRETSIPESSSTSSDKSALVQEVEDALSRSAQLLETIKTDALVSPRCVSEVGSLNTDVLLSINPQNPTESIQAAAAASQSGREGRSRHRYSYHTPDHQPRSLSVGPVMAGSEQRDLQKSGRRRSVDSLDSVFAGRDSRFGELNESMSALTESGSILKRLVTTDVRSLSDSTDMNHAKGTGPPSWIQELIAPVSSQQTNGKDLTDSLFSQREASGGRKAPSWVNGLEQSDLASSVTSHELNNDADALGNGKKLHGAETVRKAFEAAILADDSVAASELSYAGPGLNYSDLMSTPANRGGGGSPAVYPHRKPSTKVSRTSSFGGVGSSPSVQKAVDRSRPPVTMSRIFQDLAGVDATRPKTHSPTPNLSASVGSSAGNNASLLRQKVNEDAEELRSSLDRYLAQVAAEGEEGEAGGRMSEIPRCSSVVNLASGAGDHPDVPSNVTGASSITKDSNFSLDEQCVICKGLLMDRLLASHFLSQNRGNKANKLCLDDPSLTPARHSRAMSAPARGVVVSNGGRVGGEEEYSMREGSAADQDLLEGDRPWESALPSFKDPVYVGDSSSPGHPTAKSRPETPTLSGGQQPGSMEALKQMLFRLQNEESESTSAAHHHPHASPAAAAAAGAGPQGNGEAELIPALKDYDFEVEPGGQSLERALVHLGRLKTLVQTGTAPTPIVPPSTATQEPPVS